MNGFVDTAQRGVFAAPIHRLAEQLSIPLYMVEIRHDVTHGRLPSIEYLRIAAKDALRWLDVHYWLPQSQLLESLSGHRSADVARIEGLLNLYAGLRLRDLERERLKLSADDAAHTNKRSHSAERKSISPSVPLHAAQRTAESTRKIQHMLKEAETRACVNDCLDVLASALLGQLSSLCA